MNPQLSSLSQASALVIYVLSFSQEMQTVILFPSDLQYPAMNLNNFVLFSPIFFYIKQPGYFSVSLEA